MFACFDFYIMQLATIYSICRSRGYFASFQVSNCCTALAFQSNLVFINSSTVKIIFNSTFCQFIQFSFGCDIVDCYRISRVVRMSFIFNFQINFVVFYRVRTICRICIIDQAVICFSRISSLDFIRHFFQLIFSCCTTRCDCRVLNIPFFVVQTSYIVFIVAMFTYTNRTSSYAIQTC